MHQFRISACSCNCKRGFSAKCDGRGSQGPIINQWNSWSWVFLVIRRQVRYMPCGLQKALMKYKQGTEAASLGSSEKHQHKGRLQRCVSCDLLEESHAWHGDQLLTKDSERRDKRHSTMTHSSGWHAWHAELKGRNQRLGKKSFMIVKEFL